MTYAQCQHDGGPMNNPFTLQPVPTGDATARYERLSHGGAIWHDLMPTPADGADEGTAGFWPNFDGVSGVNLGRPSKFLFADAFTICQWSKQSVEPPRQTKERTLSWDNGAEPVRSIIIEQQDDGSGLITGYVWTTGSGLNKIDSNPGFNTGTWHFIVLVNEGTGGQVKLYVNTVLQGTSAGGGVVRTSTSDWYIAKRHGGVVGDDWYTGVLDTTRFYPRALSDDEILRDYYAGLPAHP